MSAKKAKGTWATLTPKALPNGRWIVSLGMVDGKNLRRKFKTKADAQDFCNTERANKKTDKTMPDGADGSLVKEWMTLDAELKTAGVESLLAAGRRALKDMKAVTKTGSAKECFDAFHAALTGKRRGKYLADLRNRCGRFMKFFCKDHPKRPVLEITSEVIEAYLKTLKNTGDFKTIPVLDGSGTSDSPAAHLHDRTALRLSCVKNGRHRDPQRPLADLRITGTQLLDPPFQSNGFGRPGAGVLGGELPQVYTALSYPWRVRGVREFPEALGLDHPRGIDTGADRGGRLASARRG